MDNARESLDWSVSATRQFDQTELERLRDSSAEELIKSFSVSDDVVVLRGLAELLLHGDRDKLRIVGKAPAVAEKWENVLVPTMSADMWILMGIFAFFEKEGEANV